VSAKSIQNCARSKIDNNNNNNQQQQLNVSHDIVEALLPQLIATTTSAVTTTSATRINDTSESAQKLTSLFHPLCLGARTAHVGLDNNRYLEILAPDDENPGPLGEELKLLEPGTLTPYHYSIRSSEVSRLIEGYVYDVLGWDPDHIAMVQALPDNSIRQWDLLTMYGHNVGGTAPCYVKWKDPAQHPTASIAVKATLTTFTVRAPEDHDVHKLITGVGGLNVEYGEPLLECTSVTPKGTLTFSANNPNGLVFPGYDDDHHFRMEE
jgi:hypothetical protein